MTRGRRCLAAVVPAAAVLIMSTPAPGAVTPTRSADAVARAIAGQPGLVRGGAWVKLPPRGKPAAISTSRLVGFPRGDSRYAVLSSGDATKLDDANDAPDLSHNNRSRAYRGTRDTVVLRVDLTIPQRARCLSITFRFLSDEFDEYIDSPFNDGFVAEFARHTWRSSTGSSRIRAPHNFAFDREKKLITINSTGDFSVTEDRARGTTYDAGTRRLRASRPIEPGRARIYLSIFDQGDRQFDSTVLIDRLRADRRRPCVPGASLD